jgi:hypothetical protein
LKPYKQWDVYHLSTGHFATTASWEAHLSSQVLEPSRSQLFDVARGPKLWMYPLVNIQKNYGKSPSLIGKPTLKVPFSKTMLNYQRVNPHDVHDELILRDLLPKIFIMIIMFDGKPHLCFITMLLNLNRLIIAKPNLFENLMVMFNEETKVMIN